MGRRDALCGEPAETLRRSIPAAWATQTPSTLEYIHWTMNHVQLPENNQLVRGSRHLASNPCVTASAFIAMHPEALPPPHSICFNATSRSESPDPEQPQTGAGLGGPRLGSLDCEHVFDRLLPTVERNIKEPTVRLAGRRAIIIRWWIEDRDSWNQRPCSKSRLAVPPADGICTPVTMT